jgi:hypothetical protein
MKIVATIPTRNSGWSIGFTARAALMWCDAAVIMDHATSDPLTATVLADLNREYPHRITILYDNDSNWNEMDQRDRMLTCARGYHQATHVALLDDDELVTGNLIPRMRGWCESLAENWALELPQINVRRGIDTMHTKGVWAEQHTLTVFRDDPRYHWKAAGDGYQHHHRGPAGALFRNFRGCQRKDGGLIHLQMASEERLRYKQWHYQLSDYLRWPERRTPEQLRQYYSLSVYGFVPLVRPTTYNSWRFAKEMTGLGPVPATWWEPYRDILKHLHLDAEPWQRAACREIMEQHPELADAGFDDFGMRTHERVTQS